MRQILNVFDKQSYLWHFINMNNSYIFRLCLLAGMLWFTWQSLAYSAELSLYYNCVLVNKTGEMYYSFSLHEEKFLIEKKVSLPTTSSISVKGKLLNKDKVKLTSLF